MPYMATSRGYDFDAIIFQPKEYNEEIALKCGLMPFRYTGGSGDREIKLIMLCVYPCYTLFMKPRLDAYQVLMSGSISKMNLLESNERYFRQVVGEKITEEVKKRLEEKYTVYFYFQNNGK